MKWVLIITFVGSFLGNRIEHIDFGTYEECQSGWTAIRRLWPATYAMYGVCVQSSAKDVVIIQQPPVEPPGCNGNSPNCVK